MDTSEEKVKPDSIVYTDCFKSYDALDVSEFHHERINRSQLFVDQQNHINGIENFWNQAKRHMRRFNGLPRHHFYLFLKECEWRFNAGNRKTLMQQLKRWYKQATEVAVSYASPKMNIATALRELFLFGLKQAWACLFGGILLFLIIVTKYAWPEGAALARYDFLFVAAFLVQALLIAARLETVEEAKIIFIFHVAGTVMEIFKTAHGSWTYPEASFIRIGGVPLFSGFMYAAVGSYLARATRILKISYTNYPPDALVGLVAAAIYLNFFTHHYLPDARGFIFLLVGALFGRTWVYFTPAEAARRMPLLLGFCLVAFFIWVGENIGTYTSSWTYPAQAAQWRPVSFGKLGAWFLLMIISFALLSLVHRPRAEQADLSG